MRVAYRESVSDEAQGSLQFKKNLKGRIHYAHLELEVSRRNESELGVEDQNNIIFDFDREPEFDALYNEYRKQTDQHLQKKIKTKDENNSEVFVIIV